MIHSIPIDPERQHEVNAALHSAANLAGIALLHDGKPLLQMEAYIALIDAVRKARKAAPNLARISCPRQMAITGNRAELYAQAMINAQRKPWMYSNNWRRIANLSKTNGLRCAILRAPLAVTDWES